MLGLLRRAAPEPQQPLQRSAASHGRRAPLASDITNRPPKVCCATLICPACLVADTSSWVCCCVQTRTDPRIFWPFQVLVPGSVCCALWTKKSRTLR